MQIARQVYKFNVPANAIIFFKDGAPAYLVKRFDKAPAVRRPDGQGGKLQQEYFAQLGQMSSETHGINYKYDLSYEEIGDLIKQYIPTYMIELEKFFRLTIFNYILSNGDAHVKNFSAIRTAQGDYVLTPVYDLLCIRIHSPGESDMALSLFKDGFTEAYEAYGFYTYADFYHFGKGLGIKKSRTEKIIDEFAREHQAVKSLIKASFLEESIKTTYYNLYVDKSGG
jgi:serine/threonine-protein kinase HipA